MIYPQPLALITITGNILIILAFLLTRQRNMRNATNFLIVNLSIAGRETGLLYLLDKGISRILRYYSLVTNKKELIKGGQ